MKCPRCGLVHAPLEEVCRRCEIDLKSGEPRTRAAAVSLPSSPSLSSRLKNLAARPTASSFVPRQKQPSPSPPARRSAPPPGWIAVFRQPKKRLSLWLRLVRQRQEVSHLSCLHCGGKMSIQRSLPFSSGWPVALLLLGALLALAGIKYYLLFFTSAPAFVLGILYLHAGRTAWHCSACGHSLPRFPG